jgi:DNA polymerase II small subunit/DNA polymerase delta subunit B
MKVKKKKERLNISIDIGIESKEILYMSEEIEKYIKERLNRLHEILESMEFWEPYIN